MRTSLDAIRSLARYMAEAFGDDYEVSALPEQGTFGRPGVWVTEAGEQQSSGSRHTVDLIQPYAIYVYPPEKDTVEGSWAAAEAARDILWTAFNVGIGEGHARRVPLYDYDGVDVSEGTLQRRYPDYLRVLDYSAKSTTAPKDERKFTVTAQVRLGWRRAAEMPSGTRLARDLKTAFND